MTLDLNGIENLPVAGNGSFQFGTRLLNGESYAVTLVQQPLGPTQACSVTGGSGSIASADAQNIQVDCITTPVATEVFASGFEQAASSPWAVSTPKLKIN